MDDALIREAAQATPDPERARNNITSFLQEHPDLRGEVVSNIRPVALLFSHSQFLANFAIKHPDALFSSLGSLDVLKGRETLAANLHDELQMTAGTPSKQAVQSAMGAVRMFRLRELMRITLRDIMKKADLVDIMHEMSALADSIVDASYRIVSENLKESCGSPEQEAFAVIALGKLGGEELNYSSDIDLIFVYGTEKGETTGIRTEKGILKNRISNHEYYCRLGEELNRFLSATTEDGFAYRVDLRLRPEGQRGDIALALRGYEMYYESWGRAWERAMLLRARPVAGDPDLGLAFQAMIKPFVYRKYLDFSAIEEIKKLKVRIDSTFKRSDIKRGHGGIREIEFFAQALQLIYGGREPLLQERSVLKVLHRLYQKGLIGGGDYDALTAHYRYLRTLEHRLQQVNDLQTHMIPSAEPELRTLAKKIGLRTKEEFLKDLEGRRAAVRRIYDSLFAGSTEESPVTSTIFSDELSDDELREYLSRFPLKDIARAFRNIRAIQNSIYSFQTLRGRRMLGEILPLFVESALQTSSPDDALNHLQSFAEFLNSNESYLEMFRGNPELIRLLTTVFSQSEYLSKTLMATPRYLEMIGWQRLGRPSGRVVDAEIADTMSEGHSPAVAIRLVRQREEIRYGLLFLQERITVERVVKGLTGIAEAILRTAFATSGQDVHDLAVIGLGKLGGRELTFGSDLDLVFVTAADVTIEQTRAAEKILRVLVSHTREGIAYRVDTRLRPEGSKGPLVASIEAFKKYYAEAAAFWEFQALLKARPVAGDRKTGIRFLQMARDALLRHGSKIAAADVRQMRERIMRERSKEKEGYDIKLGPGGIEDIEFMVQYLQLSRCRETANILVQGTTDALKRMESAGILPQDVSSRLRETYLFCRSVETLLRLRGEQTVSRDEARVREIAAFMGFDSGAGLLNALEEGRKTVLEQSERYLTGSGPDISS